MKNQENPMTEGPTHKKAVKQKKVFLILIIILVIGVISLLAYLRYKKTHVSTDDAFVDGNIYTIASRITGTVKAVHVQDNMLVKKGDLLVEIDPADYETRTEQASASVRAAEAKFAEADAGIDAANKQQAETESRVESAKANLELELANLKQKELDLKRADQLLKEGVIAKEKYEQRATDYAVALAREKAARAQLKSAQLSLEVQASLVKQKEAAKTSARSMINQQEAFLKEARLISSYVKIPATADGYISRKSVEPGNHVEPGQSLLAIVPLNELWKPRLQESTRARP